MLKHYTSGIVATVCLMAAAFPLPPVVQFGSFLAAAVAVGWAYRQR